MAGTTKIYDVRIALTYLQLNASERMGEEACFEALDEATVILKEHGVEEAKKHLWQKYFLYAYSAKGK